MKIKRMTEQEGERTGLSRFSNFHRTGNAAGMKQRYYGLDALLVRCGDYIYNVSAEPHIYHLLAH